MIDNPVASPNGCAAHRDRWSGIGGEFV